MDNLYKNNIRSGQVFGQLTILHETVTLKYRKFLTKCDCGNTYEVQANNLLTGHTTRCIVCANAAGADTKRKYPKEYKYLYSTWKGMNDRCHNPLSTPYKGYGGRGITVCKEWRDTDDSNFMVFAKAVHPRKEGCSLDRVDNSKGYSPDNWRWATQKEQSNNTRRNVTLEYKGVSQTIAEWADEIGVLGNTLQYRILRGWTVEEALTGSRVANPLIPMKDKVGETKFLTGLHAIYGGLPDNTAAELWGCDSSHVNRLKRSSKVINWYEENKFNHNKVIKIICPLKVFIDRKTKDDRKYLLNLNAYRNWQGHENNNVKTKFKEVMKDQLEQIRIEGEFSVVFRLYKESNRRTDKSNFYSVLSKYLYDAMSELGCIADDNDSIIIEETLCKTEVDKHYPRAEFFFIPRGI